MSLDNVKICLEQKKIFATNILNLTKQIEVRCELEDIIFDQFLEEKQSYIDRIIKCDNLLSTMIKNCDEDESIIIQNALNKNINPDTLIGICADICKLNIDYHEILEKIQILEKNAFKLINKNYENVKNRINDIRMNKK